jgi:hypothetical protein
VSDIVLEQLTATTEVTDDSRIVPFVQFSAGETFAQTERITDFIIDTVDAQDDTEDIRAGQTVISRFVIADLAFSSRVAEQVIETALFSQVLQDVKVESVVQDFAASTFFAERIRSITISTFAASEQHSASLQDNIASTLSATVQVTDRAYFTDSITSTAVADTQFNEVLRATDSILEVAAGVTIISDAQHLSELVTDSITSMEGFASISQNGLLEIIGDSASFFSDSNIVVSPVSISKSPAQQQTIVVNHNTFAVSRYDFGGSDVAYGSNGRFLFAKSDALYELSADTLPTQKAKLVTYRNDWNIPTIKRALDFYIAGEAVSPAKLKVNDQYDYTQRAGIEVEGQYSHENRRFYLGRGLRKRWYKFELELEGHATIDELSVNIARTNDRRVK